MTVKAKMDTSDVDLKQQAVNRQLDALSKKVATASVRANTTEAQAKIDAFLARVNELRKTAASIDVKANTALASAELRKIGLEADRIARDRDLNIRVDKNKSASTELGKIGQAIDSVQKKGNVFSGGFISDIFAIVGLLSGPLAVALGVVAVGMAGLVSVVGALGLGFGALGLVMAPVLSGLGKNIKAVTQAQTDLNNATTNADKLKALKALQDAYAKIPADQRPVVQLVLDLENSLRKIGDEVMPTVLGAFRSFLDGAKSILPFVAELAKATANGLAGIGNQFRNAMQRAATSPYWQDIIRKIAFDIPGWISKLGTILGNLGAAFVKMTAGFAPAGTSLLDFIVRLTQKFSDWAGGKGPVELQKLMEYIKKNGPELGKTLGDVARALGDTAIALGRLPLSGFVLKVLDDLAKALDAIVKTPVGAWAVGLGLMSGWILKIVGGVVGKAGALIDFGRGLFGIGDAALFSTGPAYGFGAAIEAMEIGLLPLLGIVAAVAAAWIGVGVALYFLATKWKQTTEFFKNGFGQIILYFVPIIGWILLLITHWHGLWNVIQQFGDWFRTAGVSVWHVMVNVWHGVVDAAHTLWDGLKAVFDFIVGAIHWVADNWSNIWRIIVLVLFNWLGAIVLAIVHNFGAIRDFIVGIMNFIWHNIIEPVWHAILDVVAFTVAVLWHGIIEPAFNAIRSVIETVVNFVWHNVIEPAFNGIKSVIESVMNFIWHQIIEPIWNFISSKVEQVVNFIWHSIIEPIWDAIQGKTSTVWETVKNIIVGSIQTAKDLITPIINGIIDAINFIANGIKKVAGFIGIQVGYPDNPVTKLEAGGIMEVGVVRKLAGGGCMDCEMGLAMSAAGRVGGGFRTNGPAAIVGEGRRQFPEYVVPTDPMYRGNALKLTAGLLGDLGMMASGGTIGPLASAPKYQGSLFGWPGTGFGISDLNPFDPKSAIRRRVINPAVSAVGDAGSWVMDHIRDGIAAAVSGLAHTLGFPWPTKPDWWGAAFPAESGIIGGTGNDVVNRVLDFIRGKEAAAKAKGGAGIGGAGPAAAGVCADWINQGLNWPGANRSFPVACMAARVNNESNCNPRAINLTDSNFLAGHPSVGLTQFVPSTFASQSCPGCNDIWNPVCQVCASSHCSPGNCGVGGYGCAVGGMLGDRGLPNIAQLPPGPPRRAYLASLAKLAGRSLGRTTGELMLLGDVNRRGLAAGGSMNDLLRNGFGMAVGGMMGPIGSPSPSWDMPAAGNSTSNTYNIPINNPKGETAEDSLTHTLQKLAFQGVI